MPKNLRGLYAVLLVLALSTPMASAESFSPPDAERQRWSVAGVLFDFLSRVLDRSMDGPDIDPAGIGIVKAAPTVGAPTDDVDGDDGPDADPAG